MWQSGKVAMWRMHLLNNVYFIANFALFSKISSIFVANYVKPS